MTVLYIITKYLTFPGCLVRGLWEQIVCRFSKVPVEDNRYLRRDEMMGHIEHEFMPRPRGAFAICFVPFLFNILGALIFGIFPAVFLVYLQFGGLWFTVFSALSYWFAVSLLVNAFPLKEDVANMTEKVYGKGNILQKILYTPGIAVLYAGSLLERYGLTFVLAIGITVGLMV